MFEGQNAKFAAWASLAGAVFSSAGCSSPAPLEITTPDDCFQTALIGREVTIGGTLESEPIVEHVPSMSFPVVRNYGYDSSGNWHCVPFEDTDYTSSYDRVSFNLRADDGKSIIFVLYPVACWHPELTLTPKSGDHLKLTSEVTESDRIEVHQISDSHGRSWKLKSSERFFLKHSWISGGS